MKASVKKRWPPSCGLRPECNDVQQALFTLIQTPGNLRSVCGSAGKSWTTIRLIVVVAVIVIATLQEQAVPLATGKLKVVVVVSQQYQPTKVTNVALATV